MKLNPNFLFQDMGEGSFVLVPVEQAAEGFHGIVRLNKTDAFIVECFAEETTEKKSWPPWRKNTRAAGNSLPRPCKKRWIPCAPAGRCWNKRRNHADGKPHAAASFQGGYGRLFQYTM